MELTSEQRALRDAVISVLRRHQPGPGEADSSYDPGLWRLLGEIGAPGLAIPERFGGAGAGPVETNIVAEELGKVLAPTPLLGSAVLAAQAILGSGDPDACERLLPGIAAGTTIAALAWTGEAGGWHPDEAACHATSRSGGGWTLAGTAHYVLDGDVADLLIVAARMPAGGISLFDVEPDQPGVDRSESPTVDQARRLAVVRLAAAANHRMAQAGQPALARARDLACIALSAEQAGAAARALELTVRYTGTRVQFGRTIASFQAVQHRLAEMHVLVESARSLSYRAASVAAGVLSAGPAGSGSAVQGGRGASARAAELPLLAAAAKAYCSQALATVAAEMIQLHGAIGITWEHDAHRYFKRAHSSGQLFGPPADHLARIASAVIDG